MIKQLIIAATLLVNIAGSFAADAPEFDVTVVATKGAEPQTFKVRPGIAGTELRLK